LKPKNIFFVGDPRQSIYGWRGSDINYILKFEEEHPESEIIHLTKNYRSNIHIVELINRGISHMNLPDLEAVKYGDKDIAIIDFASEEAEFEFVIQRIISSELPRNEIFVLARTNRQLNDLSMMLKARGIKHVIKNEDSDHNIMLLEDDLTLATVHAIKGLEAEMVFIIGCTPANFPCRGSEHPVVDMVKMDEYDKEEEEKRLFYVALSRAKSSLYISYSTKTPSSYLTHSMIKLIDPDNKSLSQKQLSEWENQNRPSFKGDAQEVLERIIEWRRKTSETLGVPPFMIMHDKTIHELAEKMPLCEDELKEIYGMGPARMRRFSSDILGMITKY
jgi:superfamily I DNA/RNA helicase